MDGIDCVVEGADWEERAEEGVGEEVAALYDEEAGRELEEEAPAADEAGVDGLTAEVLFAGVLLELASFWEEGLGDEACPQPARTVNRAREAARAPATFNAFPAFTVSSLLEVKRNITGQVKNSKTTPHK